VAIEYRWAAGRYDHSGTNIGLVLVVAGDDLDARAGYVADIISRHLGSEHGSFAADVGVEARHVVEHAELDHAVTDLGLCRAATECNDQRHPFFKMFPLSFLSRKSSQFRERYGRPTTAAITAPGRMIRGCFVAVTRPDAFDLAIWIKSKTLSFHTSHKRCFSYRFAWMLL
jgi:hypothetical protein